MIGWTWTETPPNERIKEVENDCFEGKLIKHHLLAWEFSFSDRWCDKRGKYVHDLFNSKHAHLDAYFCLAL